MQKDVESLNYWRFLDINISLFFSAVQSPSVMLGILCSDTCHVLVRLLEQIMKQIV